MIDDQQTTGGGGRGYEEGGGGARIFDSRDRDGPGRQERAAKVCKIPSRDKRVCIHFRQLLKVPSSIVVSDNFVLGGISSTRCAVGPRTADNGVHVGGGDRCPILQGWQGRDKSSPLP